MVVAYRKLENEPTKTIIDEDSKEQLIAIGYTRSYVKTIIFHLIALACLGFPYVLIYWHDVFRVRWQYARCSVEKATMLVLKDVHGQTYMAKVHHGAVGNSFPEEYTLFPEVSQKSDSSAELSRLCDEFPFTKYFIHQHVKYLWSKKHKRFQMLTGIERGIQLSDFHKFKGYPLHVQESKLEMHGFNDMSIDVKSYWRLLMDEVLNPFYLFEIFSCVVWTVDDYTLYAGCIFIVSIISVGVALYEIRTQSNTLKEMTASHVASMITVCRGGDVYESIYAVRLVPGDLIVIPPSGCLMPCDAVLVAGTCIVNESVLTGESSPETKTPVPDFDEPYCTDIHKRHTLFCGTQILQTRYYGQDKVKAVVIRTGFTTAKGELVRSILYPKPIGFKFYIDSLKFVFLMFCVALCGIAYCSYVYITKGATLFEILVRAGDMLTIVVPPAMPAAMTVGIVYAQSRLRHLGIFCISPPKINVCGKIKLMCFDKTGTLTEDGLDFCGVAPCTKEGDLKVFGELIRDPNIQLKQDDPVLVTMAACHTLTRIEGQLIGDPLEVEMFKSTRWVLEEPGADSARYDVMAPIVVKPITRDSFLGTHGFDFAETGFEIPYAVGIVRHFPFSSNLQRMSVVVRTLGSANMELLCKGSPEMIRTLCQPSSIPQNFANILRSYTMRGFRVLALARRVLDRRLTWHQMHRLKREQMESNLQLLGLLVMHNTLKPETTPVIRQLRSACIRCVMVTGDNLLTAINVARDCDLLPIGEKVILVNASSPSGTREATITYTLADMYEAEEEESGFLMSSESDAMFTESWPESVFQPMENMNRIWRRQGSTADIEGGEPLIRPGPRLHLALNGKTLDVIRKHFPDLLSRILLRATVLARMKPDQKTKVVEELQELGYVVGFCGDGANDCGALKAAHVGVSLSDAEASVAAPFTARSGNISCVPIIIREGRCALVTSYGVFKYMALYSLIQFISVLILYSLRTTMGDYQFLYHDLFITTTVAVLMSRTDPYPDLVAQRPKGSLLASSNLLSLAMQVALTAAIQLGALLMLMLQPWYRPVRPEGDEVIIPCWEVTVIFSISSFQYLILALAFSYGPPYRQPFYTNRLFLLSLIVLTTFSLVLTMLPIGPLARFFQVIGVSFDPFHTFDNFSNFPATNASVSNRSDTDDDMYIFRGCLVLLVALHTILALLIEKLVADDESRHRVPNSNNHVCPKNRYKKVELDLAMEKEWPPISQACTNEILTI